MQSHHTTIISIIGRRGGSVGRLTEGDVGDGAVASEDADASSPPAGVDGDAGDDVGSVGDFEDVRSEGVRAVASDDDGWLGLVLGSGWPSSWTAVRGGSSAGAGGAGG